MVNIYEKWKRTERSLSKTVKTVKLNYQRNSEHPEKRSWTPTYEGKLIGMPSVWFSVLTKEDEISSSLALAKEVFAQDSYNLFYFKNSEKIAEKPEVYEVLIIVTIDAEQKDIFDNLKEHFVRLDSMDNPFFFLRKDEWYTCSKICSCQCKVKLAFLQDLELPGFGWDRSIEVENEEKRSKLAKILVKQWAYSLLDNTYESPSQPEPIPGKSGDLKTLLLDSLNWKDKWKNWMGMDCSWEDYMVKTTVAHRVSKFEKIDNVKRPETPNPHWGLVYDENYDGALVGCVGTFFGTTRYKNCLPDMLPYPTGGIPSQEYYRMTMKLPSEAVKLWYQKNPYYTKQNGKLRYTYQVIIVLTTQEEDGEIFKKLPEYYERLEGDNPFIYKKDNQWMTNNLELLNFGKIEIQYSVNLFVLKGPPKSWVVKWSKEGVEKMEKKRDKSFDVNEKARKDIALKVLKQWAAYFKMRTAKKREEEMTERFGAMKTT